MYKAGEALTNSSLVYKELLPRFRSYLNKQETFVAVALDSGCRVVGKPWRVSLGTVNTTYIHPRDLFREAIKRNAVSIIIAHNHPSGKLDPSQEDILLTRRMAAAGEVVGIPVVDHLVVSRKGYWSFADHGQM